MQRTTAAGLVGLAVALAATAACTDDSGGGGGGVESGETAPFEEDRLVEMVDESYRLMSELEAAELRIVQNCLEDQGFTVHDQLWFAAPAEPEETETLFEHYPYDGWLPEVEEAERFGTGAWRMSDEGRSSDLAEEYAEYNGFEFFEDDAAAAGEFAANMPDNSAFEALSPQEQYDWYTAFYGEELAAAENAHLIGEESTYTSGGTDGGDGEIDLSEQPDYVEPEPGGCRREMIDALYGDMELVVEGGEGEEYSSANWQYRPANPLEDFATKGETEALYRERIAGAEGDLIDCLAERGRPDWEFDPEGVLPTTDYFWELYTGTTDVGGYPALPDDAPEDYEGKFAFEVAFAVDLAECGDETGFRQTAAEAYEETQTEYYLGIETETYAWQEEMRNLLTQAQTLIEG